MEMIKKEKNIFEFIQLLMYFLLAEKPAGDACPNGADWQYVCNCAIIGVCHSLGTDTCPEMTLKISMVSKFKMDS